MFAAFYSGSDRRLVSILMVTDKTDDGVYEKMLTVPNDADSVKVMLIDTKTMQPMKGYREFKY